jgi:uncharacterized protein (DUF1501 family)
MTSPTSYVHKGLSRRQALARLCGISALAGTGFAGTLSNFLTADAQTAGDYKALVCLFLFGGNDNANTVVPRETAAHASYRTARPSIALAADQLLPVSPAAPWTGPAIGLHPSLVGIKALFDAGRCAIVANVGTLTRPTTLAQYQAGSVALPFQLFSHSDQDQQWQTGLPDAVSRTGWLGRIADIIGPTFNPTGIVSPSMSMAGNAIIMAGERTVQYQMSSQGPLAIRALMDSEGLNYSLEAQRHYDALMTGERTHLLERGYATTAARAIRVAREAGAVLATAPTFEGVFPANNSLGAQLRMVARTIASRSGLRQTRQVFFVSVGGWDFHDNLLEDQAERLGTVDAAVSAFVAALDQLNIADRVTLFTASDFGRALQLNGRGSDHGWGAHHFVVGGAVRGNRVFGQWPEMALGAGQDVGQGRLLPTTSIDQYAATLGRWFGLSAFELGTVLPNLGRFSTQDLGFLG